jgi:MoaA/NifB/PqqE/SkfB family radical SAM enzyme/2-polyprenyl-3-methyl-5-hydroxy-6-metoxy-1,4-benzoquinol methylase
MNIKISSFTDQWQPLTFNDHTILLNPSRPDWAVPGPEAARLLEHPSSDPALALARASLENQLSGPAPEPYRGRAAHLTLTSLRECWFHLTSKCNLTCRHCLFSCSPASSASLAPELLVQGLRESRELGCTLYYFTGGEPFVYPGFTAVLQELLREPDIHAVILTNGLLLEQYLAPLTALPRDRVHLQISLDGLEAQHDNLRGPGTFHRLLHILDSLRQHKFRITLSVAVNRVNIADLPALVELAATQGVSNLHFLWHFVRGQGNPEQFVGPSVIFPQLIRAQEVATDRGVIIDNIETIRSQVFSSPGTRFDLSNTGWESLAIGPDGRIYPSPALVGLPELDCGHLAHGLSEAWRNSPVLGKIRRASLLDSPELASRPLSLLIGGGDLDHSYLHGGEFVGHDPYLELYENLALWLITRQAARYPVRNPAEITLRMGDVRHDCPDGGQAVSLTHCNCVVSLPGPTGHKSVREFYGQAALQTNDEIVNPFAPSRSGLDFIPLKSRQRSYGCGSPVLDAEPTPGETLVDLGSGSGFECFVAARQVGRAGKVYGIDMTREMLDLARESKGSVVEELGYDNLEFRQGYLEEIPLPDQHADVVISNCVINLSPDKRTTFHEIYRVLKPGGRLVVSDIVTDQQIPLAIKNNQKFRGECLGGALQQEQLLALLRAAGFTDARLIKRFPYREEGGTRFFSLTFSCRKPSLGEAGTEVIYRGPLAAVMTEAGQLIFKGRPVRLETDLPQQPDDFFRLDANGAVSNLAASDSCGCGPTTLAPAGSANCCAPAAEYSAVTLTLIPPTLPVPSQEVTNKRKRDCLICGSELIYSTRASQLSCHYCGKSAQGEISCPEHYVCDDCHQTDGLAVIKQVCTTTGEQDLLALLHLLRSHPALPLHGPEHHALVPGIILAAWLNCGGSGSKQDIHTAIDRGSKIPGGVCGLWGSCGTALGVGIAFAVILEASPLTAGPRQEAQRITARVMGRLAASRAPRCCRREALTALLEASAIARENFGRELPANYHEACGQTGLNRECLGKACPYWD